MPRWIEWIQDEHEYGMTMPVVPRIESPPRMPRRALVVFSASASPPGIDTVISTSPVTPWAAAREATMSCIIRRGAGLIAGSPMESSNPGRVTVPTPAPARKRTPEPSGAVTTVTTISAPSVTSGSSPASLTMPTVARV